MDKVKSAEELCTNTSFKETKGNRLIAGGHFENFEFCATSPSLVKKTKTKEVEFYIWLYYLADISLKVYGHQVLPKYKILKSNVSTEETARMERSSFIYSSSDQEDEKDCNFINITDNFFPAPSDEKSHCFSFHLSSESAFSYYIKCNYKSLFVGRDPLKKNVFILSDLDRSIAREFIDFIPNCIHAHLLLNRNVDSYGAIELNNLVYQMKTPLILDIKIGKRLHGDEASEEKKQRAKKLVAERSHSTLGFSLSGMCGFTESEKYLYIPGGKRIQEGGRSYSTEKDYFDLLFDFITAGEKEKKDTVLKADYLLRRLMDLYDIFKKQKLIAFYGSSLLFVKDSSFQINEKCNSDGLKKCKMSDYVKLAMIDFAHVTVWNEEQDLGYLEGLHNLIQIFRKVIDLFNNNSL